MFKKIAEAGENDTGKRTDRIFRTLLTEMSLGAVYKELRKGTLRVNRKKTSPEKRIEKGDTIDIHDSLLSGLKNSISEPDLPGKGKMPPVLFEDKNIIAVNKPSGISVHKGGNTGRKNSGRQQMTEITLESILRSYLSDKISESLTFNSGPLNRLDKNTSGIVFFGKSVTGARNFTLLQKNRMLKKTYLGLIDGILEKESEWSSYLEHNTAEKKSVESNPENGKIALTKVFPLFSGNNKTIALFEIKTGRYHQIRKQAALNSHPLTGDVKYSGSRDAGQYALHCLAVEAAPEGAEIAGFSRITAAPPPEFYSAAGLYFSADTINRIKKKISLLI